MSETPSAQEAELGHAAASASARTPRNLAAALDLEELKKIIEDRNATPDFLERLVAANNYRLAGAAGTEHRSESPASSTSPMALSMHSASTRFEDSISSSHRSIDCTPPLTRCSTIKSEPSVRTSVVDLGVEQYGLEEDETGALVVPAVPSSGGDLICLFNFLDCAYRSNDFKQWNTHCKAHLHGCLPKTVHCPHRCGWTNSPGTGEEAWKSRTYHILSRHSQNGIDPGCRPEESLLSHMWRHDIIDNVAYQELTKTGKLQNGQAFTSSTGPNRHRRRERPARRMAR